MFLSILFPILKSLGTGIQNDAGGPALAVVGIVVLLLVAAVIIVIVVVVVKVLMRMRKNKNPKDE